MGQMRAMLTTSRSQQHGYMHVRAHLTRRAEVDFLSNPGCCCATACASAASMFRTVQRPIVDWIGGGLDWHRHRRVRLLQELILANDFICCPTLIIASRELVRWTLVSYNASQTSSG